MMDKKRLLRFDAIKRIKNRYLFRRRMREMDEVWRELGGGSWQLFPPSFYYTHTPEEIKRITDEEIEKIRTAIDDFSE